MDEDELYFDEEDLEEEEPEPEDAILDAADAADRAFDLAEENRKGTYSCTLLVHDSGSW